VDAIVAILDARIVPRTPGMIGRLSMATGVPVAMIKKAWELKESGHRPPLPTRRPIDEASGSVRVEPPSGHDPAAAQTTSPEWLDRMTPAQRALRDRRKAAKEPVEGMRLCSSHWHEGDRLIPRTEFSVKDQRTGSRRAWCKACMRKNSRSRYLTSTQQAKLGAVLRFVLEEGDAHADVMCADCGQPCRIGDEVVASDAVLRHAEHQGPNI
jgi:hypothetical protein